VAPYSLGHCLRHVIVWCKGREGKVMFVYVWRHGGSVVGCHTCTLTTDPVDDIKFSDIHQNMAVVW